jgi:hypothetical protein
MSDETTPTEPRVLTLTGTPFPKALVQSVDAAAGVCLFAWLNAAGERVDSGGSVARFTPCSPLPPAVDAAPDAPAVYPEVLDATLADAIAHPPAEIPAPPAPVTRRQLFLWLNSIGITRAMLRAQLSGNEAALIELEEAQEFRREHPLVAQLGQTLGLSSAQIDAAFRAAALL